MTNGDWVSTAEEERAKLHQVLIDEPGYEIAVAPLTDLDLQDQ